MNPALKSMSIKAMSLATGGVMLGTLLAWHANPVPKPRPPAAWEQLFQREDITPDKPHLWIEAPPTDVVADWQDSWRPDLDYDTVVTGWAPPPLPVWSDDTGPAYGEPSAPPPAPAIEAFTPPIERAGDAAQDAAAEALAIAAAPALQAVAEPGSQPAITLPDLR